MAIPIKIERTRTFKRIPRKLYPSNCTTNVRKIYKENDVVLDLFFGSGTSGIEAINMNRRCIGVELKDDLAESVSENLHQNN